MVRFQEELKDDDSCRSLSLYELSGMDKSSFDHAIEEVDEDNLQDSHTTVLAVKETRGVMILRVLFAIVLLLVAVGVSVSALLYSRGNEKEDFERAFTDNGRKIVDK